MVSAVGGRSAEDEQKDEGDGPGSEQGEAGDPGDVAPPGRGQSYQVESADCGHDRGTAPATGPPVPAAAPSVRATPGPPPLARPYPLYRPAHPDADQVRVRLAANRWNANTRLRSGRIHLFSCDVRNWQYFVVSGNRVRIDRTLLAATPAGCVRAAQRGTEAESGQAAGGADGSLAPPIACPGAPRGRDRPVTCDVRSRQYITLSRASQSVIAFRSFLHWRGLRWPFGSTTAKHGGGLNAQSALVRTASRSACGPNRGSPGHRAGGRCRPGPEADRRARQPQPLGTR